MELVQDLAIIMIVAGVVTVLCHLLRQPVVLGYIIAGVIVGKHTPPFALVTQEASIRTIADIGVILLMLSLGLQFSLRRLLSVGATAFIAASLEISLMIWIGYQVGQWFGWSTMDSIFLGAMLLSSSTVIIVKALNDLGLSKEPFARFVFGILVLDDMFAIAAIALLSGVAMSGTLSGAEIVRTAGQMGIFLAVTLIVGLLTVPPLLKYVARFKSDEMLLITVLGLGFGMALLAVRLEYSTALGAFLIGALMAESRVAARINELIEPIRDMFSAVFFVAVGMMFDPALLRDYWPPVLVIAAVLVVGKLVTGALGSFVAGNDIRTSVRVGASLAQIGEFAIIISQLGLTLGVTSDRLYPIAVCVAALTTLLTPPLIRNSDRLASRFVRLAPRGLVNYLDLYTHWVSQLGAHATPRPIRALIRKTIIQVVLNLALVTGIFAVAIWLAPRVAGHVPPRLEAFGGVNSVMWLAAMVLSLPLLTATFRKARAMAMLAAEITVPRARAKENTNVIRSVVTSVILAAAVVGLAQLVLLLSSTILPPGRVLVVLLLVVALVAVLSWRSFIQVYAKAQLALHDTLADMPPGLATVRGDVPAMLRDAGLDLVVIGDDSPAARRYIRELNLRSRTGASIVGIERAGQNIINPGPDEELLPGDQVLLLGRREQLDAARLTLTTP